MAGMKGNGLIVSQNYNNNEDVEHHMGCVSAFFQHLHFLNGSFYHHSSHKRVTTSSAALVLSSTPCNKLDSNLSPPDAAASAANAVPNACSISLSEFLIPPTTPASPSSPQISLGRNISPPLIPSSRDAGESWEKPTVPKATLQQTTAALSTHIDQSPPSLLAKLRGPNWRRRRSSSSSLSSSEESEEAAIPFDKVERQWLQQSGARRQSRASSVDYKETMRSLQKLKEAPRLSLDSKLSSNSSSPAVGKDLPGAEGRSMFGFSGNVVAKLMGLEELPSSKTASEAMATQLAHTNNICGNHASLDVAHGNLSMLRQHNNSQQADSFYYNNLGSYLLKQTGSGWLDHEQNISSFSQLKRNSNSRLCNQPEQVKQASEELEKGLGGIPLRYTSKGRAFLHIGGKRNPSISALVPKSGVISAKPGGKRNPSISALVPKSGAISAKPGIVGFSYRVETSRGLPQDITNSPSRDYNHSQSRKLEIPKSQTKGKEKSRSSLTMNNCSNSSPLNSKECSRRLNSSQSESNNKHKPMRRGQRGINISSGGYHTEDDNTYCSANSHHKWPSKVMGSAYSSSDSSHFKENSNVHADNLEQQPSPVSVLEVSFGSPSPNTDFDLHHYSAAITSNSDLFESDNFHDCLNSETETAESDWVNNSASQEESKKTKVQGFLTGVISAGEGLEDLEGIHDLASIKSLALINELLIGLEYGKLGEENPQYIYTKSLALAVNELRIKVEDGKGVQHSHIYSPGESARHEKAEVGGQNRSLLQDVLCEVLRRRLWAWAAKSFFHGRKGGNGSHDLQESLLKEVLLEVKGRDSEQEDISAYLVQQDLSHPHSHNEWRECDTARLEIGVEIERLIVKDLIQGIIQDLMPYPSSSSSLSLACNIGPRKSSARQLFAISDYQ